MIFFIGFPRSGTSLIHEGFSLHEETAWPTNYSSKYPKLHFLNKLALKFFGKGKKDQFNELNIYNRFKIKPAEAYRFWNSIFNFDKEFSRTYLKDVKVSSSTKNKANREIRSLLKSQDKDLFTAKITGPGRILFLKSVFPDAKFIHVIRDGRYAANSLSKLEVWNGENRFIEPWWANPYIGEYRKYWSKNLTNYEKSLLLWLEVIENIDFELSKLDSTDFMNIRYEDYIKKPREEFNRILSFSNLNIDRNTESYFMKEFKLKSSNNNLSNIEVQSDIKGFIEKKIKEKGYTYEHCNHHR